MRRIVPATVSCAVEGVVDEAVARRVIAEAGVEVAAVHGGRGKHHLLRRVGGYNNAARHGIWLVLVDLDRDYDCAPPAIEAWAPTRSPGMHLRIAVRAVEAWLLADRERAARFLGVSKALVPGDPEGLPDPKRTVVELASRSRRRDIREGLAPRPGSGRSEGEVYASLMVEYVNKHWRPDVAAEASDSLQRCLGALAGWRRNG